MWSNQSFRLALGQSVSGLSSRFAVMALCAVGASCTGDDDASQDTPAETVTWNADIEPLVANKCGGCHTEGGIAPFSMDSYKSAKPFASAMASAVESGTMPPFLAQETESCQPRLPWANDLRLSGDEKKLLRAWADAKAPEGKSKAAGKVESSLSGELEREDVAAVMPNEVKVAGTKDIHTCAIIDPGLTEDAFVVGRMITAGNSAVLHHVVSYIIQPGKNPDGSDRDKEQLRAALREAKGVDVGGRYDCFGGPALPEGIQVEMLDAWAPGGIPNLAPPDSGQPIDKDSLVLLDLHYHPTGGPEEIDDGTKLSLMLSEEKPAWVSKTILLGNFDEHDDSNMYGTADIVQQPDEAEPEFLIPAGESRHIEEGTWTWKLAPSLSLMVYGAGTHMHYVGRDMRVTLEHPARDGAEASDECLIETPRWDFNWQRGYMYAADSRDELPTFRDGDVLRLHCEFDNTLDNPNVAQALAARGLDEPVDVKLGEDTLDEMCLVGVGIMYPNM